MQAGVITPILKLLQRIMLSSLTLPLMNNIITLYIEY